MENVIRRLLAVMVPAGSMPTIAIADGTDPPADCDAWSNPHCIPPPPAAPAPPSR